MTAVHYNEGTGMRIAVDAHALGRKLTGNETYVRNLLREYAALRLPHRFVGYVSSPDASSKVPESMETRIVSANPFVRLGWQLTARVREDRPDILHVQYTAPLGCPVPVVTTVHDVSFLERPEFFSPARALQLRITVKRTVARAARIIAPSEFSRDRIARAYNLDPQRIEVIHNGVDPRFRPLPREQAARRVLQRYGFAFPYVLTVGDLQARKNQAGLVRAFVDLLQAKPELPHHLVLVGKENWHGKEVRDEVMRSGLRDRIHFTGFAAEEDLVDLYSACDVFAFPSLYEGFGLPILEAMACGRAVACSNTSAIPEVADSAAILFDPTSKRSMTLALRDLLIDAELRARMERLGLQRAGKFSWRRAAEETLSVYRRVVGEGKSIALAAQRS